MTEYKEIKFSVVTPVYNVEKYVKRCVESVLEQTYQQFELILVDDGSTDASASICQEFAEKDSRIKVIRQKNGGQLSARCTALRNATGDYYVFLDSDDYLERDTLETIRSAVEKYRCECVLYDFKRFFEDEGRFSEEPKSLVPSQPFATSNKKEIFSRLFAPNSHYESLWRKAIKANLISKDTDYSSFYCLRQGEDALQSLEIYRNLTSAVFLPDRLYVYCIRPSSASRTFNISRMSDILIVNNAEYDFLQNEVGSLFTTEELLPLKTSSTLSFIGWVMFVCDSVQSSADKRTVLEQMRRSEYFSKANLEYDRLKKGVPIKKRIVMFLFRRKAFGALITLGNCFRLMRNFVKASLRGRRIK